MTRLFTFSRVEQADSDLSLIESRPIRLTADFRIEFQAVQRERLTDVGKSRSTIQPRASGDATENGDRNRRWKGEEDVARVSRLRESHGTPSCSG
jgi:hypothetical protein